MASSTQPYKSIYYRYKRYINFGIITVVALVLPFLRINDNHFFLLSFDKKQLHLLFTSFDMQELYLMPFLLIILFLGIFFMTTLGGRVWCGWMCPQTIFRVIFRDLIETKLLKIRRNISNKQSKPKEGQWGKKALAIAIWAILSFIAASNFMWYFVPPEDYILYLQNPADHPVLLGFIGTITAFLIYNIIFLKENFCIFVCPYARVQSVMYDDDTIQTIYDTKRGGIIYDQNGKKLWSKPPGENDECTGCEACVRVCPTHIDIRKGMQLECINCLECADACTKVMNKLGKETLIAWTSPNAVSSRQKVKFVRARTIGYGVVLLIAFSLLMFMSTKKEHMLLNINRTTRLYKVQDDKIQNAYTFLFQNTDHADHTYYFEVNHPDIKIDRPQKPFLLEAGKKAKKIVVLSTDKELSSEDRKDSPIPIKIKAYAVDAKDFINVERDAVFVYPRKSIIDDARK
jgi:cytochrome c oxidase accessory protein FixG